MLFDCLEEVFLGIGEMNLETRMLVEVLLWGSLSIDQRESCTFNHFYNEDRVPLPLVSFYCMTLVKEGAEEEEKLYLQKLLALLWLRLVSRLVN